MVYGLNKKVPGSHDKKVSRGTGKANTAKISDSKLSKVWREAFLCCFSCQIKSKMPEWIGSLCDISQIHAFFPTSLYPFGTKTVKKDVTSVSGWNSQIPIRSFLEASQKSDMFFFFFIYFSVWESQFKPKLRVTMNGWAVFMCGECENVCPGKIF